MTIIEAHRVRTIHRTIEGIEPTTNAERMVHRAALVECSRRRREVSTMSTVPAYLLGPLTLLLFLLMVLAGPTLGGYPEAGSSGTGSQGQISDSLRIQTPLDDGVDDALDEGGR